MLFASSQLLWIENKTTQLLNIKEIVLRSIIFFRI
jgi:hypothetical protein